MFDQEAGEANLPQKPESRPTEKHELSRLKVQDSEYGPTDSSMTCRVFMVKDATPAHWTCATCMYVSAGRDKKKKRRFKPYSTK